MSLTPDQLKERKSAVFSTDLPAILGCDPWKTATDVWAEKTLDVEPWEPNEAAEIGTMLEPAVLDWAEKTLGPLIRDVTGYRDDIRLGSHMEAVLTATGEPVEVKTGGLGPSFGPVDPDYAYGDFDTDEVPLRTTVQCHAHMLCLPGEPQVCHVPVLLGGRGRGMFQVPRSERLCKIIMDVVPKWWERYVVNGERPSDQPISADILKRIRREPGSLAEVDPELMRVWLEAKEAATASEGAKKTARNAVVKALGTAEGGTVNGQVVCTYLQQTSRKINKEGLDALTIAHPEIAAKFVTEKSIPFLRAKKVRA